VCHALHLRFILFCLGISRASLAPVHRRCQCAECSRDPRVAGTLCSPLATLVMFSEPVRAILALRSVLLVRKSFARMWNLIVAGFSKKFVLFCCSNCVKTTVVVLLRWILCCRHCTVNCMRMPEHQVSSWVFLRSLCRMLCWRPTLKVVFNLGLQSFLIVKPLQYVAVWQQANPF